MSIDVTFSEVVSHVLTIIEGSTGMPFIDGDTDMTHAEPASENIPVTVRWSSMEKDISDGPFGILFSKVRLDITTVAFLPEDRAVHNAVVNRRASELYDAHATFMFTKFNGQSYAMSRRLTFRDNQFFAFSD